MELHIKSKKVTRRQLYFERFDSIEPKELVFVAEDVLYDEQGRILQSLTFAQENILEEKVVKSYNNNTITTEYYIDENEISEKTVIETDSEGKILTESIHYADGTVSTSTWTYENNKPVSKITIDIDEDEQSGIHNWYYDAAGNLEKEQAFEYGEMVLSNEWSYNEAGNVVSMKSFISGEPGYSTEAIEYEGDRIVKVVKTDPHGNAETHNYSHNEHGNIVLVKYESERHISETAIEYNAENNPTHELETREDDEVLYEITRVYNPETKLVVSSAVFINRLGDAPDIRYTLEYNYEFFR
ncbi:MAG: hypothetical protein CVU11_15515 [Bacteroidetes bacterium HGW-Bacteroidetes-6]|jgi:hypothetical protein|nr:MAG: hypothetical protein CVU11_15515 [Bacteroidetes bacterium HGW-Bacteroidetes-6]